MLEVTKNETVLVVKAKLAGARIIKVIVRDSGHNRHTRSGKAFFPKIYFNYLILSLSLVQ